MYWWCAGCTIGRSFHRLRRVLESGAAVKYRWILPDDEDFGHASSNSFWLPAFQKGTYKAELTSPTLWRPLADSLTLQPSSWLLTSLDHMLNLLVHIVDLFQVAWLLRRLCNTRDFSIFQFLMTVNSPICTLASNVSDATLLCRVLQHNGCSWSPRE